MQIVCLRALKELPKLPDTNVDFCTGEIQHNQRASERIMETTPDPKGLGQLLGRSESLTKAKKNLKRKLIQTMIQQVMDELSDPEATASEAMEALGEDAEVLQQAKEALKSRLLNKIMSEAIEEIGDEVGEAPTDDLLADLDEEALDDLDGLDALDEEVVDVFEEMMDDDILEESEPDWEWNEQNPADEELGEEASSDPFFSEEVSSDEETSGLEDAEEEADHSLAQPQVMADEASPEEHVTDEAEAMEQAAQEALGTAFIDQPEEETAGVVAAAAALEEEAVETSGVSAAGFEDAETFIRDLSEHEELLFEGDFLETAQLEIDGEAEEAFSDLEALDSALSFDDDFSESAGEEEVAYFGDIETEELPEEDAWLALPDDSATASETQGDSLASASTESPDLIVEEPVENELMEAPEDDATILIDTDETRTIIWEDFQAAVKAPEFGYYVYGVMPDDSIMNDDVLPQQSIYADHQVFTYQHGTIQALVSRVPLPEFSKEMVREHIEDDQWVEQYAPAHEKVLEQAMQHATLIPMRFGTVFETENELKNMLDGHQEAFKDTLSQLQGSQEWGMKIFSDVEQLRRRVMEDSTKVQELMNDIKSKPRGVAHFIKKQMVVAIHEEVESATQNCVKVSHESFLEYAEDSKLDEVQEEKDDELGDLVMSATYLVRRSDEGDFMAQMMNLRERFRSRGFSFNISGPFPPYSFTPVQASEGTS